MHKKNNEIILSKIFFALSDPTRRKILRLLLKKDLYATQISEQFAFKMPTISRHLKVLADANLISRHNEAQRIRYMLQLENLNQAQIWIETLGGASLIDYDKLESLFSTP